MYNSGWFLLAYSIYTTGCLCGPTFQAKIFMKSKTVNSYEKKVNEEKTLQEQIEGHIELLERVNKTVCSNSSHPQYELYEYECESSQGQGCSGNS